MASSRLSHVVLGELTAEPSAERVLWSIRAETPSLGCRLVCFADGLCLWEESLGDCSVPFSELPAAHFVRSRSGPPSACLPGHYR